MNDLETFRTETRAWLDENCPLSMRTRAQSAADWYWGGKGASYPNEDLGIWFERLRERGWIAPDWPTEYGGGGLDRDQTNILTEEMNRLKCRKPLVSLGVSMLGPVIMEFGTTEQKERHLKPIARGEVRWCQGYSEPGAGSDLRSLRCRADRQGEFYVVDGQKIWTSEAHKSDSIFCLVRTYDENGGGGEISFLLIDLDDSSITAEPIQLISGASEFCVTTFSGTRVQVSNRLGEEGEGWTIAKRLLQYERNFYSQDARGERSPFKQSLADYAVEKIGTNEAGELSDPLLRAEVTQVLLDQICYSLTLERSKQAQEASRGPGPETSIFKYYLSEMHKRRAELRARLGGDELLCWEADWARQREQLATREWLRSRADSIAGGTTEIQLNIIAKRVLGLPE